MNADRGRSAAARRSSTIFANVFGDRLHSVVAYGPRVEGDADAPLTCLALVEHARRCGDLEACARPQPRLAARRLATPLILPDDEFRSSLDAFPLEYGEIIRAHERVFGDDPFDGVAIAREDSAARLRNADQEPPRAPARRLHRVRRASRRPIADLVGASAPAFAALLRHVARLNGDHQPRSASRPRAQGARPLGSPTTSSPTCSRSSSATTVPTTDPARLFPEYLAAVEQLARAVDAWRVLTTPVATMRQRRVRPLDTEHTENVRLRRRPVTRLALRDLRVFVA